MAQLKLVAQEPPTSPTDLADDAGDWLERDAAWTTARGLTSLDADADQAGEADQLSRATGVPPAYAYENLDQVKEQHKAALTRGLLENNQYLKDYIASHPLASKVSNDDWGQLDKYTAALDSVFGKRSGAGFHARDLARIAAGTLGKMLSDGWEAFSQGGPGQQMLGIRPEDQAELLKHPGVGAGAAVLGMALGIPELAAFRAPSALVSGLAGGGAELLHQLTGQDFTQQKEQLLQTLSDPGVWASTIHIDPLIGVASVLEKNARLRAEIKAAAPYIKAGQDIPPGVSTVMDQVHAEQAKWDLKALDNAFSEAQKSTTKERSPELFKTLSEMVVPDARIGISHDGLEKLWGGEIPKADDSKLGWIPDLPDKVQQALEGRGDLEVPLADWLAHADPELHREVGDFLRLRRGGMTLDEAKQVKPVELGKEAAVGPVSITPLDSVEKWIQTRSHFAEEAPESRQLGVGGKEAGIIPLTIAQDEGKPRIYAHTIKDGKVVKEHEISSYANFPLSEGLKQIRGDSLAGVPAVMDEFWKGKLTKIIPDMPVRIVSPEEMSRSVLERIGKEEPGMMTDGFYSVPTDEIYVNRLTADGSMGHARAAMVLLHEGAHAVTIRAMIAHPELAELAKSVMNEARSYMEQHLPMLLKEHEIDYAFTNHKEFLAQGWSSNSFRHVLATIPMSEELKKKIGLKPAEGNSVYDAFRRVIKLLMQSVFGSRVPETMIDGLFHLQERFEQVELERRAKERGEVLPAEGVERAVGPKDELLEKGLAIGVSKGTYSTWKSLMDAEAEAKNKFYADQAEKNARIAASKEWKESYGEVRKETEADLRRRPDFAADRFLREGDLYGEKVQKVRLARDSVPPELRDLIPPEYLADRGVHPDDLAPVFGYHAGRTLVQDLARLKQERDTEGLTPAAHFTQSVDRWTERQMRLQHGPPEDAVLEAAKDQAVSDPVLDRIGQELFMLAEQHGITPPFAKGDIQRIVKESFDGRTELGAISADKFMQDAGRAGNAVQEALLEGKPTDAFKVKQQQYVALLRAAQARKLEKLRDQFEKRADRWSRREPPGIEAEDAVWIHDILMKLGQDVSVTAQDHARMIALSSEFENLRDYVNAKNTIHDIYNQDPDSMPPAQIMPVADFLQDPAYRTTFDKLTPDQFRAAFDSLKAIDKYSRDGKKLDVKGTKRDLAQVLDGLITRLAAAVGGKKFAEGPLATAARTFGSLVLTPESWFQRLDLGNKFGPFSQLIVRPLMEGQYQLRDWEREFAKKWRDLPDFGPREKIENTLFMDPDTKFQTPLAMDTHNMWAVLANMGNERQRQKLARGYGIDDSNKIWQWLAQHGVTAEHVKRAQQMGDIFSEAFGHSESAYTRLNGYAPARIDLFEVETPWGPMKEWYHPLIPDPMKKSPKIRPEDMIGESGYFRPSPAAGYAKARTGAIYPVDLSFDRVPFRLKQILNDAAMREPIVNVGKIVFNDDFQNAFRKYYGPEYSSELTKWMKDAAGNRNWVPAGQAGLERVVSGLQQNMATLLIGWNLGTVMKHAPTAAIFSAREVGAKAFAREALPMLFHTEYGTEAARFAMENSEELRNRLRSIGETISATNQEMFKREDFDHKLFMWKDWVRWLGSAPVAASDFASAVPMWMASYKDGLASGMDHGAAVYKANTDVRRTHGSTIITSRAAVMRMNPWVNTFMPFYNFFNNAFQRNYELGWKAKLALTGRELPQMTGFEKEKFEKGLSHTKDILGGVLAYGVMVSMIEQWVDPLKQGDDESDVEHWAKILTRGPLSMVPFARDIVNALYGGRDPSAGLMGTAYRNVKDALTEKTFTAEDPGKTIRRVNSVIGTATGLTFDELGKVGQFGYNWLADKDAPDNFADFWHGIRHGRTRKPSEPPDIIERALGAQQE